MAAADEQTQRIRAEGEAEAIRIYAAAFGQAPEFYRFLRTLEAYRKILDGGTTLFLPVDAEIFGLLQFDVAPRPMARPAGLPRSRNRTSLPPAAASNRLRSTPARTRA